MKWHKPNWGQNGVITGKSATLDAGWRPLLMNEVCETGDEYWFAGTGPWIRLDKSTLVGTKIDDVRVEFRTRRPLPGPAVISTNIQTPRMEAALRKRFKFVAGETVDDRIGKLIGSAQACYKEAIAIERELVIATDENAHQFARAKHFETGLNMAQGAIRSLEAQVKLQDAELANVRKELEELKALVRKEKFEDETKAVPHDQWAKTRKQMQEAAEKP
jgi:hypothetical protein